MKHITLGLAYQKRKDPFLLKIPKEDRLLHMFALGQTGTGKSTLMSHLVAQDITHRNGLCLIDPHGDLSSRLHERMTGEHIYWDASERGGAYGFNPLRQVGEEHRALAASGFIEALKQQWPDAWGPRMEHILRQALLALLERPDSDLRDVLKLMIYKGFRRQVAEDIEDEQVRRFWKHEFPAMNYQSSGDGVAAISNKLSAFLAHPAIRQSLCEPKEHIRFRAAMDTSQIILINLAKGRLGADNANILGGLITTTIMNAAFTRTGLPEAARRPFFLYVDEFANFSTRSFANMLSEARKLGLGLILAQQHVSQMDAAVREAVFGNVGTMVVFRVGVHDAPLLTQMLHPFIHADLINQPNHRAVARIMKDGEPLRAFSMSTFGDYKTSL